MCCTSGPARHLVTAHDPPPLRPPAGSAHEYRHRLSETGPRSPIAVTCERPGAKTASIEAAIAQACDKIAPLWPLKHFVAVNPFLGFSDQSFAATCATLRRVAGVDMLMPRAFYRQALAAGTIEEHDLE
ncbi:DUF2309 family protein, partial [Streptomyces sp. F63]|uniref:putative inorganic carbon transporter subunit DabA n=1 Tax=Streptomyces sp. F63 TaxID=2824887 RepID=UPI001B37FDA9|nr:DUF2309 family protein [Streptomyces sp. F63]